MIKGLLCHLRIIVFVVVYALGAYAPFDQHFADAQGYPPVLEVLLARMYALSVPQAGRGMPHAAVVLSSTSVITTGAMCQAGSSMPIPGMARVSPVITRLRNLQAQILRTRR